MMLKDLDLTAADNGVRSMTDDDVIAAGKKATSAAESSAAKFFTTTTSSNSNSFVNSSTLPVVLSPPQTIDTMTNPNINMKTNTNTMSSIVINIPTPSSSSPCSPRLAHLRPQNPLMSSLEMQRINRLLATEPLDPSKLSPISPLYPTSDLGSSPRSSISVTTSSMWGPFRDQKISSSDLTDCDSDCNKDVFSPGFMLSPAPFSPFSDCPPETPSTGDIMSAASTSNQLRFTFDALKSPTAFYHSSARAGHNFLLPPTASLGVVRERSRSDSETLIDNSGGGSTSASRDSNTLTATRQSSLQPHSSSAYRLSASSSSSCIPRKKQILERYQTEVSSTASSLTFAVSSGTCGRPSTYHTSACQPGIELPILRIEPNRPPTALPPPPPPPPPPHNLHNQACFDLWLKQQILAANSILYPATVRQHPSSLLNPLFGVHATTSTCHQPPVMRRSFATSQRSTPIIKPVPYFQPASQPYAIGAVGLSVPGPLSSNSSLTPGKPCKRSRSESDMTYICQHCGQSFGVYDRLAKHIASRHRDRSSSVESPLKTHKCTVCHKAFGRSDMLTRHMRLHTGIKPYSCRVCGQVFSRSDHLSTHQRTHTGEKPYQCPQCSYAASRRDMITRHMRTHTRGRANTSSTSSTSSSYRLSSSGDSPPGRESSGKSSSSHGQQHYQSHHSKQPSSYVSVIQQVGDVRTSGVRLPTTAPADSSGITVTVSSDDNDDFIVEKACQLCVSPMSTCEDDSKENMMRLSTESAASTIVVDEESFHTATDNSSSSSSTASANESESTPRVGSGLYRAVEDLSPPIADDSNSRDKVAIAATHSPSSVSMSPDADMSSPSSSSQLQSPDDINQLAGSISEINVKMEPG